MPPTKHFLQQIHQAFSQSANPTIASGQKSYLKDQFAFFGIKTDKRREIQKPFLEKKYLPPKEELNAIVKSLWMLPEREFHYFSQELVFRYAASFEKRDIALFEFMITEKSWWDTVDFIATKILGSYFKLYPDQKEVYVKKWIASGNMWLQRSALLFQLKYKDELDTHILSATIQALLGSKEFFINKAIGWILREYSRTNPEWVEGFVRATSLASLSEREALRILKT